MANAGPTTEILLKRVREQGGFATDQSFAMQVLSRCQRVVNAGLGIVVTTDTLSTPKEKLLYSYREEFTDAIDIVAVRISIAGGGTKRLHRVARLEDFSAYEEAWWRNITGEEFLAYCQVGRELLVLYPGLTKVSSVTIDYTKLTTEVDNFATYYNTELDLPDENIDDVLSLAEAILLVSSRRLDGAKRCIEALSASVTQKLLLKGITNVAE